MANLPALPENYAKGLELIDEAHALDPRPSSDDSTPFELRYAQRMTQWLAARCPSAPPALQLACRAQHFRRYYSLICPPSQSSLLREWQVLT